MATVSAALIEAYFDSTADQSQAVESRPLHDPCVMVQAADPSIFGLERLAISVDMQTGALDVDDHLRRHVISQLMCNLRLDTQATAGRFAIDFEAYFARELNELAEGPVADGFLEIEPGALRVTTRGRLFVRNICMIFDRHLREKRAATPVFSRTI